MISGAQTTDIEALSKRAAAEPMRRFQRLRLGALRVLAHGLFLDPVPR